jgi:hypothetical protein
MRQFPSLTRGFRHPPPGSTHYKGSGEIIEVQGILSAEDIRECVGEGEEVASLAALRRILHLVWQYFWNLDPFDKTFREPVMLWCFDSAASGK